MSIKIGQTASFAKTITEGDISLYAGLVGDLNPIHINEVEAGKSVFHRRVAHGMFAGGLISAVIGMKLPGPGTIYLEQDLKFRKPIYIGDTITARVIVADIINLDKGIYRLDTALSNQDGDVVTEGYAVVKYN